MSSPKPASPPPITKQEAPRVPASRYAVFWGIVVLATGWDLFTKAAVFSSLGYPGRVSPWTRTLFNEWLQFRFLTSFNEGALWGIGQEFTFVFAGLSLLAVIGILIWLFVYRAAGSLWLTVTLALVMSGTLGNLYDRLGWHGCEVAGRELYAVRDFLCFTFGNYHYPIFNFADVFLITGAIMLGLYSFLFDLEPEANKKKSDKE